MTVVAFASEIDLLLHPHLDSVDFSQFGLSLKLLFVLVISVLFRILIHSLIINNSLSQILLVHLDLALVL